MAAAARRAHGWKLFVSAGPVLEGPGYSPRDFSLWIIEGADTIKVAASFTVLGDMVKQIGGDRVEAKTFVGPNGDAHVYEPSPRDVKALADSKILGDAQSARLH